jgi:hypothetical protein
VMVKLDPELYWELKRWGMRTKPRKTYQDMIVEAIRAYLQRALVLQALRRLGSA